MKDEKDTEYHIMYHDIIYNIICRNLSNTLSLCSRSLIFFSILKMGKPGLREVSDLPQMA